MPTTTVKGLSLSNTSSSSSACIQKIERDNEYLKAKNLELTQEVAHLRAKDATSQEELYVLQKQKFELDCKYNRLCCDASNLQGYRQTCLNKFLEFTNTLTDLMKASQDIASHKQRNSDGSLGTSQKLNNSSCKQVVTPHAVNGHVLHTPTIRLARYRQDARTSTHRVKDKDNEACTSKGNNEEDIDEEGQTSIVRCALYSQDPQTSTKRVEHRDNEASRSTSNTEEDSDDEESDINEEEACNGSFIAGGNSGIRVDSRVSAKSDEEDSDSEEDISMEESFAETNIEGLYTIQEELHESESQVETEDERSVFSDVLQKGNSCIDQIPDKASWVTTRRGNTRSASPKSNIDDTNSSLTVETDQTIRSEVPSEGRESFNENTQCSPSPKTKSFVKRKSIGSPVPAKYANRKSFNKKSVAESASSVNASLKTLTTNFEDTDPSSSNCDSSESSDNTLTNNVSLNLDASTRLEKRKSIRSPVLATYACRESMNKRKRFRKSAFSVNASIKTSTTNYEEMGPSSSHDFTSEASETTLTTSILHDLSMSSTLKNITNSTLSDSELSNRTSVNSFLDKTIAHSTLMINFCSTPKPNDVKTPFGAKVTTRRRRPRVPVVCLTRLELPEDKLAKFSAQVDAMSREMQKCRDPQQKKSITKPNRRIKKEVSDLKKEHVGSSMDSSRKVTPSKVKREKSPVSEDSDKTGSKRPRRGAAPASFKEPSLNKKMRRSR